MALSAPKSSDLKRFISADTIICVLKHPDDTFALTYAEVFVIIRKQQPPETPNGPCASND